MQPGANLYDEDLAKKDETERKNAKKAISSLEIICVGTELLMGQIVNTNAAYIAKNLSLIGIPTYYQTVVGDNPARLEKAVRDGMKRSDAIILTGGLGPTADDITMEITAKAAGVPLEFHEESAEKIRSYFKRVNREMVPSNLKQAMLPKGCIPIPNNNGTAPGAIIEIHTGPETDTQNRDFLSAGRDLALILLPGPPSEMRLMFDDFVKPYLAKRAPVEIRSRFVRLFGIGESAAESKLRDLIDRQSNPTIAPYCSEGECMFRISSTIDAGQSSNPSPEKDAPLESLLDEVKSRIGEYIYEIGDRPLPKVVFDLFDASHQTLSFAESCTAGLATAMIADFSGASRVLKGSVVAYSNEIKECILKVPHETLTTFGAVSDQTARAMAAGCRAVTGSDYAVSITGIAGPEGGTEQKPVGLVYICAAGPFSTLSKELRLTGNRSRIRHVAALHAYDLLRRMILDDNAVKNR